MDQITSKTIYSYINNIVQERNQLKSALEYAQANNKANEHYITQELSRWHWKENIIGIISGMVSLGLVQSFIHWFHS